MSLPWTAADYRRDASDQRAEADADALNELYAGRDEWDEDDGPTRAEVERDELWAERNREWWS